MKKLKHKSVLLIMMSAFVLGAVGCGDDTTTATTSTTESFPTQIRVDSN